MKSWQAGLVVGGAAVAAALALRMADVAPPPASVVAQQEQAAVAPAAPAPAPRPAVRWRAAPPAEDTVAAAPPAIYMAPAPVPRPAPAKPAPVPRPAPAKPAPGVPAQAPPSPVVHAKPIPYEEPPRRVTLTAGMRIAVRASDGVLAEPVVAEGLEIAERGAKVGLREQSGLVRLTSFQSADGQRVDVSTEPVAASGGVIRFRLAARITITEKRL